MMDDMVDLAALVKAGFKKALSAKEWESRNDKLHDLGMNRGGQYNSPYVLERGEVLLIVEQNTSTIIQDGSEITTKHPPVVVVKGPKASVVVSANDTGMILAMAEEVA
jgi:hypothetical protein